MALPNDPFSVQDLWRIVAINPLSPIEGDYLARTVADWRRDTAFAKDSLPEPITWEGVKEWILGDKGTLAERARLASLIRESIGKGILPSYKADYDKALLDSTLPGNWVERVIRSIISALTDPATWKAFSEIDLTRWTNMDAAEFDRIKKAALAFLGDPNGVVQQYIAVNAVAIEKLVEIITGLPVPTGTVKNILDGSISPGDKQGLGRVVFSIVKDALDIPSVASGFLSRTPGEAELANLEKLFGAQFRLELGGIAIEAVEPFVPHAAAQFLKTIREAMENTINLDDAAEEIFQAPIEELINKGLVHFFNRHIKPIDMTDNQAQQALIAEMIDKATYDKILDNHGIRDDIRDTLLDLAAKNLAEGDLRDAYNHGLIDEAGVKDQWRQQTWAEPERSIKTKLVVMDRRWKLEDKVKELYGNLYRDGVATREEVAPFLRYQGFSAEEEDLWFKAQELERRQRRWLSVNQVMKLVEKGMMRADYAIEYFIMQGMTGEDATVLFLSDLLDAHHKKLPEDCQKVLTDAFSLSKVLAAALGKIPEFGLDGLFGKSELQKIIECLLTAAKAP